MIQQFTFGPSEAYERPSPALASISESSANFLQAPSETAPLLSPHGEPPLRTRRMSSSFSRISYGIHDDADHEEVKMALEGKHQDGIVGALFGKSVGEQVGSSWFW